MRILYAIAIIILIIGGLAWGIVGLFDVNILAMFGADNPITALIYVLVGLAAIVVAVTAARTMRSGGERETRPEAAQPPEGGTPVRGGGTERTDETRPGDTPQRPGRASKDPKKPGTTGATGAGPGGTP